MDDCISYRDTHYFSDLMLDYLDEKEILREFYHHFPTLENFKKQIEEKNLSFPQESRIALSSALKKQYSSLNISEETTVNLDLLQQSNTFTITTGHQLNLFTGPLYFLYKIISVINLAEQLKEEYSTHNFVPIYWMATEDHDFEEINYFNFKEDKIQWNSEQTGAVGEFATKGLEEVLTKFKDQLNKSNAAEEILALFKNAYLKHTNLTEATRYLGNELFGKYGLVIVDGNDNNLKKMFAPYVKEELLNQLSSIEVEKTAQKLKSLGYKAQVNAREINLFYLTEGIRERIIKEDNYFFVNNTEIKFSESEILEELKKYPERFSPNVIMRPLYQEVILPNLCYVGGGGELAYWLELKNYFEASAITFPVLLLRNSALLVSEKQNKKLQNLKTEISELFLDQSTLKTVKTNQISEIKIDFSPQKEQLATQFKELYVLAEKTDSSFIGAVEAQEKKQIKGLHYLEKRLLKAQKRKLKDELCRVTQLQDELFPKQSLQERNRNFSEFYQIYGSSLIQQLKEQLKPLELNFSIIYLS